MNIAIVEARTEFTGKTVTFPCNSSDISIYSKTQHEAIVRRNGVEHNVFGSYDFEINSSTVGTYECVIRNVYNRDLITLRTNFTESESLKAMMSSEKRLKQYLQQTVKEPVIVTAKLKGIGLIDFESQSYLLLKMLYPNGSIIIIKDGIIANASQLGGEMLE